MTSPGGIIGYENAFLDAIPNQLDLFDRFGGMITGAFGIDLFKLWCPGFNQAVKFEIDLPVSIAIGFSCGVIHGQLEIGINFTDGHGSL
jgi:hypothetical protein